jgi:hypothetical protein
VSIVRTFTEGGTRPLLGKTRAEDSVFPEINAMYFSNAFHPPPSPHRFGFSRFRSISRRFFFCSVREKRKEISKFTFYLPIWNNISGKTLCCILPRKWINEDILYV